MFNNKETNKEFVPECFEWMTLEEQKRNAKRLENITNKQYKNQILKTTDKTEEEIDKEVNIGTKNQIIQTKYTNKGQKYKNK